MKSVYTLIFFSIACLFSRTNAFDLDNMSLSDQVGLLSFILHHSTPSKIFNLENIKPMSAVMWGIGLLGYKLAHKWHCKKLCQQAESLHQQLQTTSDIAQAKQKLTDCANQLKAYVPEHQNFLLRFKYWLGKFPIIKQLRSALTYDAQEAKRVYDIVVKPI